MRLRIQTKAPLPELKVWYSSHSRDSITTIPELKDSLCRQVPSLRIQEMSGKDILLFLDDFQVLDVNSLDVVRDGDLLLVSLASGTSLGPVENVHVSSPTRRIRESGVPARAETPVPVPKKTTTGRSRDTPAESDLPLFSSSSSASSSLSSPGSSPGSLSTPMSRSTSPVTEGVKHLASQPISSKQPAPPGQGKPQTRNRNIRRRLKRKYDAMASNSVNEIPHASKFSQSNVLPLGVKGVKNPCIRNPDTVDERPAQVSFAAPLDSSDIPSRKTAQQQLDTNENGNTMIMMSHRNKNKRRGRQSISVALPPKIIFDDDYDNGVNNSVVSSTISGLANGLGALLQQEASTALVAGSNLNVARLPVRLTPPSELQERGELPFNMFVTSVDVEEEKMSGKPKKRRMPSSMGEKLGQDDIGLQYQQPKQDIQMNDSDQTLELDEIGWHRVENDWEHLTQVTNAEQLKVGIKVAWQGLRLNPLTFSPEISLSIASVVRILDTGGGPQFTVKPVARPLSSDGIPYEHFAVPTEEEDELPEAEHKWNDIIDMKWRLMVP